MFTVILRNVVRNIPRMLPIIVIIVAVFTVMIVGNAVLSSVGSALRETYVKTVAGDISVSAKGPGNFTLFGSDELLVGDFVVPPVLPEYSALKTATAEIEAVKATAGLVTAVGSVNIDGTRRVKTLFGVSFADYTNVVTSLSLLAGRFPGPGERGIVVQSDFASSEADLTSLVGRSALVVSASDRTFTIREIPVTGVFDYPLTDDLLDSVVLADAQTVRALNNYSMGGDALTELSVDEQSYFDDDLDSVFGTAADEPDSTANDAQNGRIDLDDLFGADDLDDTQETPAMPDSESTDSAAGPWNFLLIRLTDGAQISDVSEPLDHAGYTDETGYLVRPWYQTVGGNAILVRALQLVFNIGVIFVAFGAMIISTNALLLSILERIKEIGTMRALGASKIRVGSIIGLENAIIVIGASIIGITAGVLMTRFINMLQYSVENAYLQILFGGEPVNGTVSPRLVLNHISIGLVLSVLAIYYPLRKVSEITPFEAMRG